MSAIAMGHEGFFGQDVNAYHTSYQTSQELGGGSEPRNRLLDWPSDPHPILDWLMSHALWLLYCSGDAPTMRYDPDPRRGESDHILSSGVLRDIEEFRDRYARCWNHRQRFEVIGATQREAANMLGRISPDRSHVKGTAEWRDAIVNDPRSSREVAIRFGISHMTVVRMKRKAGVTLLSPRAEKRAIAEAEREAREKARKAKEA